MIDDPTSSVHPPVGYPRSRRRRWPLYALGAVLLVVVGLGVWGLVVWQRLKAEPAHWMQAKEFLDSQTPEQLETMADDVQARVLSAISRVERRPGGGSRMGSGAPGQASGSEGESGGDSEEEAMGMSLTSEPRTIRIGVEEANAWLTTRLKPLLANRGQQWPSWASDPIVGVEGRQILASVACERAEFSGVLSLGLELQTLPDGQVRLQNVTYRGGQQRVPQAAVNRMRQAGGEDKAWQQLQAVLDGQTFNPSWEIPGDAQRNFRVLDLKASDGAIELTLRTEPKPKKSKGKP